MRVLTPLRHAAVIATVLGAGLFDRPTSSGFGVLSERTGRRPVSCLRRDDHLLAHLGAVPAGENGRWGDPAGVLLRV